MNYNNDPMMEDIKAPQQPAAEPVAEPKPEATDTQPETVQTEGGNDASDIGNEPGTPVGAKADATRRLKSTAMLRRGRKPPQKHRRPPIQQPLSQQRRAR
jgi:hypothetical protein